MRALRKQDKPDYDLAEKALVWLIGPNSLQNHLLGAFLKNEIGIDFKCIRDVREIARTKKKHLYLYDCFFTDYSLLWLDIKPFVELFDDQPVVALFNVEPNQGIERGAVDRGIRGVFYRNENPFQLPKGILSMLKGELWFSRKAATKLILTSKNRTKISEAALAGLTTREKEILLTIASGLGNNEIADKFCISGHTVKNHLYNIYRKINVKNRFQATLWVAKHL